MPAAVAKARPTSAKRFKVRTGCITCKIRKVKCDEGKPACKRCTDTGRKCDGYLNPDDVKKGSQRSLILGRKKQLPDAASAAAAAAAAATVLCADADAASLSPVFDADERQWLLYFSMRTGPALSGLADKAFWSRVLPQLSFSEPAIRHALLAVGSSHARFEAEAAADPTTSVVGREFSIRHYNLAIASLQQQLTHDSETVDVPLICCLLFICLECLYGNRLLVLAHLRNGLNILHSARFQGEDAKFVSSVTQKLHRIFRRLDAQSTLFGKPASTGIEDMDIVPASMPPSSFADIFEAKRSLDILISLSLNFIRSTRDGSYSAKSPSYSTHLLQRRLQEQFLAWRSGLEELERRSPPRDEVGDDLTTALRIEHNASFIYLSNCLEAKETSYDAYHSEFAAIVHMARGLSTTSTGSPISELSSLSITSSSSAVSSISSVFSLDASLIPSLFLTAIKCRDPFIRREAISLLEANPGREGLWDAKLHGRVGRRVVEIEEGSMLMFQGAAEVVMEEGPSMRMQASNGAILTEPPDERFRVRSADINKTSEEPSRSAHVTFFTAPGGITEKWVVWEEELYY